MGGMEHGKSDLGRDNFCGHVCGDCPGEIPPVFGDPGGGRADLVVVFLLAMQSLPDVWKALSLESMAETTFWYTGHMTVNEMNTGINWSTILFISGMMIMVEGMSEAGFFDWLCLRLAKLVNYKPVPLMICFMILSAVLSMFIDSITVILFLAVASVRLAHLLKFDPIPLIIAEISPPTWAVRPP